MEFTTAANYGMDITYVLLNNAQLGKITKEQRAGQWQVMENSLHNPSFAMFAKQCGGHGVKVSAVEALDQALARPWPCQGLRWRK